MNQLMGILVNNHASFVAKLVSSQWDFYQDSNKIFLRNKIGGEIRNRKINGTSP